MEGFILAGGLSTRMGETKADLVLGGSRFIDRAVDAISGVATHGVRIVGGESIDLLGIAELIPDEQLHGTDRLSGGPIVGLYTALLAATSDRIAVLSCDMPLITKEVFRVLANLEAADYDAVVPIQPDGFSQPLCGIYRRRPCLVAARAAIRGGTSSVQNLLQQMNTRFVQFSEFDHLPGASHLFLNVNTPGDFQKALAFESRQLIP